jgi:hypothetical protein
MFSLNLLQMFLGCSFLLFGCLVYLSDRSVPNLLVFLLPEMLIDDLSQVFTFGKLNLHLPTFLHPTALILITASLMTPGRRNEMLICLSWLLINGIFEIGQHAALCSSVGIYEILEGYPFLFQLTGGYFEGTFDPMDLVSIFTGSVLAYFLLQLTRERNYGF